MNNECLIKLKYNCDGNISETNIIYYVTNILYGNIIMILLQLILYFLTGGEKNCKAVGAVVGDFDTDLF